MKANQSQQQHPSLITSGFYQKKILQIFSKINANIIIVDADKSYIFDNAPDPTVTIHVNEKNAYRNFFWKDEMGAAESYFTKEWETNNLTQLIEIFVRHSAVLNSIPSFYRKLTGCMNYFFNQNTHKQAKKNIASHYDLGNDFFKLFLDEKMMYSCALYEKSATTLEQASIAKLHKIGSLLELSSQDHLLEIGSGWGGLCIYAAQQYGCRVTTTTISNKQFTYLKKLVADLNLQNQITVLNCDYRQLQGQYDKLVSIEMIEAVGHRYFDTFFKQCDTLLKPGGLMMLQSIVMNDQGYPTYKNSMDFIRKYIFPGGCLPAIYVISDCIARNTNFQCLYLNDIGDHYIKTINDWRQRFQANEERIKQLGLNDEFMRRWYYYFCYCEAGFRQKHISNIQALWRKKP